MARKTSAAKRIQVGLRNNLRNRNYKSLIKTVTKKITSEISADSSTGNIDNAAVSMLVAQAYRHIDKAAKKGVIHKNSAARKKSILAGRLKRQSVQ